MDGEEIIKAQPKRRFKFRWPKPVANWDSVTINGTAEWKMKVQWVRDNIEPCDYRIEFNMDESWSSKGSYVDTVEIAFRNKDQFTWFMLTF